MNLALNTTHQKGLVGQCPKQKPQDRLSLRLDSLRSQELIRLGIAVCNALENTIGKDGFHGGIRPDNIYIGPDNTVLLGPSSHRKASELGPDELEYVPPELFWSGEMTPSGDVYSLGLILYAGLNGAACLFATTDEIWASDRAESLQRRMKGEEIPPGRRGCGAGPGGAQGPCFPPGGALAGSR